MTGYPRAIQCLPKRALSMHFSVDKDGERGLSLCPISGHSNEWARARLVVRSSDGEGRAWGTGANKKEEFDSEDGARWGSVQRGPRLEGGGQGRLGKAEAGAVTLGIRPCSLQSQASGASTLFIFGARALWTPLEPLPGASLGKRKGTDTATPRAVACELGYAVSTLAVVRCWAPSPEVRSDHNFGANPAVATRALQDEQRHRYLWLLRGFASRAAF